MCSFCLRIVYQQSLCGDHGCRGGGAAEVGPAVPLHRPEISRGSSTAHSQPAASCPTETQSPCEQHSAFDRDVVVVLRMRLSSRGAAVGAGTAAPPFQQRQSNDRYGWRRAPVYFKCDACGGIVVIVVCAMWDRGGTGIGTLPARGAPMDGVTAPCTMSLTA